MIAATASPFKFPSAVLFALTGETPRTDEFEMLAELEKISKIAAPEQLLGLKDKPVRFDKIYDKNNMTEAIFTMLGI